MALLERWRPETHTFHLPIGECTVTLEDVYMLLGLRIDGKAVNGKVNQDNNICNELLGDPLLDDETEGDTSSQARGQAWGWSRMPSLAPENERPFVFPFATKWSVRGMNYNRCPKHAIVVYRNLLDHIGHDDFVWRPYLGLDHDVNHDDVAVWTAKTPTIRFTTVEMHQSDRVKLQFGMLQHIPESPTCLGNWHQKRVDAQWDYSDWRDFAKDMCRQWRNRRQHILMEPVIQGVRPTQQYMAWFRSVTTQQFVSEPRYLMDSRQLASSSTSAGPSNQPSLDQVSNQRPQTPQENRGRPRRQPNAPGCGTGGRYNRAGH
ncbi:hypothetical protein KIW84_015355 [Lathyrus oleraceus]|uniref:Aminotransferase-like plant mobile domain-containing protein n=1 Tax=Pisum sativum TaxID=3888 RepID=A0A9D5BQJ1_PEA|nr:hypothetical protein KIW84_015355 [Pisum sativum]